MTKRISALLFLVLGSWLLELGLGTRIVAWYWGTPWYSDRTVSMAGTLASIRHYPPASTEVAGITTFVLLVFLVLHLIYAVWFGLFVPTWLRYRLGARRPSDREVEHLLTVYQTLASAVVGVPLALPRRFLVADGPGLQMRYIGYVLVIDRELLWHRHFPPLLATQLGHANSEDRLAQRLYVILPITPAIAGIVAGLPFAVGHVLLFPLWMLYFRQRIYAADTFAVSLGQGRQLIRALEEIYLKLDQATRGGRWLKPVPYVEHRIHRIEQNLAKPKASVRVLRII